MQIEDLAAPLASCEFSLGSSDVLSHAIVLLIRIDCIAISPDTCSRLFGGSLVLLETGLVLAPLFELCQTRTQQHSTHILP